MRQLITLLSSLLCVFIGSGVGRAAQLDARDRQFVSKAAMAGMAEVKLAQLAVERASDPSVKGFAERMINDHQKANEELRKLADEKGLSLPTALSSEAQATYDRLSQLKGAEFDRAYNEQMVKDHEQAVKLFTQEAGQGQDEELKAFASKLLPTLRMHDQMAHRNSHTM